MLDHEKARIEEVIQDQASKVINSSVARKQYPSYGYTKTLIRDAALRMEGMIGMYMILSGQSRNPDVTTLCEFRHESTAEAVRRARGCVLDLDPTKKQENAHG